MIDFLNIILCSSKGALTFESVGKSMQSPLLASPYSGALVILQDTVENSSWHLHRRYRSTCCRVMDGFPSISIGLFLSTFVSSLCLVLQALLTGSILKMYRDAVFDDSWKARYGQSRQREGERANKREIILKSGLICSCVYSPRALHISVSSPLSPHQLFTLLLSF